MNFQFMPELGWNFGYPLALFAMLLSAIIPFLFFPLERLALTSQEPHATDR